MILHNQGFNINTTNTAFAKTAIMPYLDRANIPSVVEWATMFSLKPRTTVMLLSPDKDLPAFFRSTHDRYADVSFASSAFPENPIIEQTGIGEPFRITYKNHSRIHFRHYEDPHVLRLIRETEPRAIGFIGATLEEDGMEVATSVMRWIRASRRNTSLPEPYVYVT